MSSRTQKVLYLGTSVPYGSCSKASRMPLVDAYRERLKRENTRLKRGHPQERTEAKPGDSSEDSSVSEEAEIVPRRHKGVVVVSKIHDPTHTQSVQAVVQSLCLFTAAYNHRMRYDVTVFATLPVAMQPVKFQDGTSYRFETRLKTATHPATLRIASDIQGMSLTEHVHRLNDAQKARLLQRCNVSRLELLTWKTQCLDTNHPPEIEPDVGRPDYGWQAEFRGTHIWTHPALAEYKYMLWLDADAFCTEPWRQDPIDFMVRNDLVLLFDNLNGAARAPPTLMRLIRDIFQTPFCGVSIRNGSLAPYRKGLHSSQGQCGEGRTRISLVHGFFHIANLDFYRRPPITTWLQKMHMDRCSVAALTISSP